MSKFSSSEIIKLLDNLIGLTTAQGDSAIDVRVAENLKTLIDVTNWCLDGIYQSSETMGRYEYSMNKIGFDARCALLDYKKWLEEVLREDGET